MNARRTTSTKAGWTKMDRLTYQHVSGLKVRRNVNTNRWEVIGASENDGSSYSSLWLAMHYANGTKAEWK
jgi:hypothetical protein